MAERHDHQEYGDCAQVLHPDECWQKTGGILGAYEGLEMSI